ncbi:hypothetical protein GGR03_002343 [Aurantimonas endophytica]|uniref:Uncharacterized protein n=1 Tax=Aurantimonas endophytica TaxID=1522175 RepID=A0A7W6HDV7_9HYPH|nr:hypothetical protein [Aurantimonas endophytica]
MAGIGQFAEIAPDGIFGNAEPVGEIGRENTTVTGQQGANPLLSFEGEKR